jgi:hypothetical protein
MIDWYSEYMLNQARRQEMACAAELERRLREWRKPLAYRLGAALILIGRSLQGSSTRRP